MISTMSMTEANGSVPPETGEDMEGPIEQSNGALSLEGEQEEGKATNGKEHGGEDSEPMLATYVSEPVPYAGAPTKKEEDPFRNLTTAADQEAPANNNADATRYVRLRGLPFSATEGDVKEFFGELAVQSLHFTQGFGGRPSGECYCELSTPEDVKKALELDKKAMKKRYIEVFEVNDSELAEHVGRVHEQEAGDGCVVRLRGLPFSATTESISEFMDGCQVVDVVIEKENGGEGRPSGEAYVRLAGRDDAERALQLNRKHMGHRYIEVFRSTAEEMQRCNNPAPKMTRADGAPMSLLDMAPVRPPPGWSHRGGGGDYDGYDEFPRRPPPMHRGGYGGGGGRFDHGGYDDYGGGYDDYGGYGRPPMPFRGPRGRPGPYDRPPRPPRGDWSQGAARVQMRGLPYKATAEEIEEFFAPMPIVDVLLGYGEDGRPSGDGAVEFESAADAREAMSRNHNLMGKRYIELFLGYDGVPGTRSRLRSIWGGRRFSQPRRPPMGAGRSPAMAPSYDSPSDYGRPPNYDQYSSGDMYGGGGYDAAPAAPAAAPASAPQGQHSYHQQYEQQQQQYWQQAQQAQHAAATAQAMAAATNSSWQSSGPQPIAQQPVQSAQKTGGPPSWINY